jgi:hypothetical protein
MQPLARRFGIYFIFGISALVLLLIFIIWQIVTTVRHGQMGSLGVQTAPSDMTLTIDGKKIADKGTVYVGIGKHTWKASRDHFTSKTGSVNVSKGKQQQFIVFLLPSDATGTQYLKDHPDEAYLIEGLTGTKNDQLAQQQVDTQPLLNLLPFIGPAFEYRIDYGETPAGAKYPQQPGIYISANSDQAKQDALDWMNAQGYDPTKMNIVYQALPEDDQLSSVPSTN